MNDQINIEEFRRSLLDKPHITLQKFHELINLDIAWHRAHIERRAGREIHECDVYESWKKISSSGFFDYWLPIIISKI